VTKSVIGDRVPHHPYGLVATQGPRWPLQCLECRRRRCGSGDAVCASI